MTADQLTALLDRLVARDKLTADEAAQIMDAFLAGDLGPLWPAALTPPLLVDEVVVVFALGVAMRRIGGRIPMLLARAADGGPSVLYQALERLGGPARERVAMNLLDAFAREADRRTAPIPRYADGMRRFHVAMRSALRADILTAAMLATDRALTPRQIAALQERTRTQEAYLHRFVEQIAAREALAAAGGRNALTPKQIAARARSYGGAVRGAYYQALAQGQPPGTLVYFEGADDPANCGPCERAMAGNPYTPDTAPIPGDVCLGGGACRHFLRFEYAD